MINDPLNYSSASSTDYNGALPVIPSCVARRLVENCTEKYTGKLISTYIRRTHNMGTCRQQ